MELEKFWSQKGCVIQQPYDIEVGAGTMNPATFLRALGPETLEGGLRRAEQKAHRRPLWGEPEQAATLLSVSGDFETLTHRRAGAVSRKPREFGNRPARARHSLRRG